MPSLPQDAQGVEPHDTESLGFLSRFRRAVYAGLHARADALFDLADAVLCAPGPVRSLAHLSLEPEYRRGHGALYDAVNAGGIAVARIRWALDTVAIPRIHGRIVLGVDVSPWLRPDAPTSAQRLFCHTYGRAAGTSQMIPGWPYQVVAALETGRTSWTMVLDVVRLGPAHDATARSAHQLREVLQRLIAAGHWKPGDPAVEIVMDSGYDVTRLAFLLADLPVVLTGRVRSDRVMLGAAPARCPGAIGRPARHGAVFTLAAPPTWPEPEHRTTTETTRYGTARTSAWHRMHPRLTRRAAWLEHPLGTDLPIIEGTLIRLEVEHLPGDRAPVPVWLWTSRPTPSPDQVDATWQGFLRRFDLEHTFRFLKQHLGWTTARLRDPGAADRWTWLVIVAYTQLRLARGLVQDLRLPWERPTPPERLSPARVRRGFRYLRPKTALPAGAPKPTRAGPGRPPGTPNRRRAPRYEVGKTTKRAVSLTQHRQMTTTTG